MIVLHATVSLSTSAILQYRLTGSKEPQPFTVPSRYSAGRLQVISWDCTSKRAWSHSCTNGTLRSEQPTHTHTHTSTAVQTVHRRQCTYKILWQCTYCSTVTAYWQGAENVYYCINYINRTSVDGWKKSTKLMIVATQFAQKWCHWMLQWYCLLNNVLWCSAIDCCSTFCHKLLDTKRSVN